MMHDFTKYLKLNYKPGGRGDDGTIDCYGLFHLVVREVYNDNRFPDYKDKGILGGLHGLKECGAFADVRGITKIDTPTDGAFVQMNNVYGMPAHCGIVVNGDKILHADEDGVRIETIAHLRNRIISYWK